MTRMFATGLFRPRKEAGFLARMQAGLLPFALVLILQPFAALAQDEPSGEPLWAPSPGAEPPPEQPAEETQPGERQSGEPAAAETSLSTEGEPTASEVPSAPTQQVEEQPLEVIPLLPPEEVPAASAALEDVVVTAQKRQQSVQQVPISMSVMAEPFIREQGITDLRDALLFVPNFRVVQTSYAITPQCRGFVVEFQNSGFEPPCGVAVDGIAYTRAWYFANGLFDTERIEVLRGPQGTTFGKNTTAGVVSLTTKDPTSEFTSKVDLQYGPDGRKRGEAGLGGPLIRDWLDFRVAAVKEDRQGFARNTTAAIDPAVPEYGGGRDREGVRAKVLVPDLFGTQLKLAYQTIESNFVGATQELVLDEAGDVAAYFRQYDPNADFTARNWINSIGGPQIGAVSTTQTQLDWTAQALDWDVTLAGAAGSLDEEHHLEVISAPVKVIYSDKIEQNSFQTAELRAVSPELGGLLGLQDLFGLDLGNTTALIGIYYLAGEIDPVNVDVLLCQDRIAAYIAASQNQGVPPATNCDNQATAHGRFNQDGTTSAVFGQVTWNLTQRWLLELGGRFTDETKTAHWHQFYSPGPNLLDPQNDREFVEDRTSAESGFQPKLTVGFAPTADLNFFAHWARGFKSGGFNQYTPAGNPENRPPENRGSLDYGPERAQEWGVDAKMDLLDRRMRFNVSLYRLDVDDFQVLTLVPGTPIPGTTTRQTDGYDEVVNAGKARAQGVEADITYLLTDWLTAIAAVGFNDTEFLSFPLAVCRWDAVEPERDPETERCDAAGKSFPYTPEWNNTFTLQSYVPLGGAWAALTGMDLLIGGTAEYVSEYYLSSTLDERVTQPAFWRYRAHLGFANKAQGWDFRITGLNLTDEYILSRAAWDGTFFVQNPEEGRLFYGQLGWTF